MIIGTSNMTSNIDNACSNDIGIPMIVMMENAVHAAMKHIDTKIHKSICVICGMGNNGGDGFGIARHLILKGIDVKIFAVGNINKLSECAKINFDILKNMDADVKILDEINIDYAKDRFSKSDACIDALFGTGLKRNIEGIYRKVIEAINEKSAYTYAIDMPSGLSSDTGKVMGISIKADKTISFEFYKRGLIEYSSDEYKGEVVVEKIGVPKEIKEKFHNYEFITEKEDISKWIKKRKTNDHKGSYGKVTVFAGSRGFSGAAYIAAQSAVKTGSGLVTLVTEKEIQDIVSRKLSEAMTCSYDEKNRVEKLICDSDAVAVGPGMGNNSKTLSKINEIMEKTSSTLVIDADGINSLSENLKFIKDYPGKVILTPHPGELSRLTGKSISDINSNRIDTAKEAARTTGAIILLKGNRTVITDGYNTFVNPTGNSAMANGGMGDCLTGIIASLCGMGTEPLHAAAAGAYIHGYIADIISEKQFVVNASDIINYLPVAIKEILR